MSRYGDTPEGMVESAMEFLRICKTEDFSDVVVSLKSSNTQVMAKSTRLTGARLLPCAQSKPKAGRKRARSGDSTRF